MSTNLGAAGIRSVGPNTIEVEMMNKSVYGQTLTKIKRRNIPDWMKHQDQDVPKKHPWYFVYIRTFFGQHFIATRNLFPKYIPAVSAPHPPKEAVLRIGYGPPVSIKSFQPYDVKSPHNYFSPYGRIYITQPETSNIYTAMLESNPY